MDSYTLIAKLRKARRANTISAGAQGLFCELVAINNEEKWSEVFKCTAAELCGALNVSEKTLTAYRYELMRAQLVGYKSGQNKRTASTYCLFGSRFGSMIGSNIYHQKEYQTEHQMVEKTPDFNKQKSKTETETIIDDDIAPERKKDFEEAVVKYFTPPDNQDPEKEKSCAKKENVLPTHEQAALKLVSFELWRHVIEHHGVTEAERTDLFKYFYEYNQDAYKIRYPSAGDMLKHFYNWIPVHKNKSNILALNQHAITRSNHLGSSRTATGGNFKKDIPAAGGFGKL